MSETSVYQLWRMLHGHIYYFQGFRKNVLVAVCIIFVILFISSLWYSRKQGKAKIQKVCIRILFAFLCTFILITTLVGRGQMETVQVDLIPFGTHIEALTTKDLPMMAQLIWNVLVFVPFGFLLPQITDKPLRFWKIVLVGIGTSLTIEIVQCLMRVGVGEIDDLLNNTFGVCIGFVLYKIFKTIHKNIRNRRKQYV